MCLAPYVFYPINPILLPSTFFFGNCIEMPFSIQKTTSQTKTNRFRVLNLLKLCYERVFPFVFSCFVGSLCDTLLDDSMTLLPRTSHFSQSPIVEKHIQHFIDFCPALDPGFLIHVDASLFYILIHSSPYSRRSARFEFRL